jgi:hypothetical protein
MPDPRSKASVPPENKKSYRFLHPRQVEMIDEALRALGPYGEVRLIVEKGRLRFVVTQTSHDALKWQPGSLSNENHQEPER